MIELRKDPLLSRWVIINDSRDIISDFGSKKIRQDRHMCPFCAGNESLVPRPIVAYDKHGNRIPADDKNWNIRVIPNNKPVLKIESAHSRRAEGIYDKMEGVGAHEIIIDTPDHDNDIEKFSVQSFSRNISVVQERINDLKNDIRLEYILFFKNCGAEAGSMISHPHSQLIAMPIIPKTVKEEMESSKKYYDFRERCLLCDIKDQEMAAGTRLVMETDSFVAFIPYASRFPFETWIMPKEHGTDFSIMLDKSKRDDLALIHASVIRRICKVLDNPSYNFVIHSLPLKTSFLPYYHWHIEIVPKITKLTGFELGSGMYVNPVMPEEAAKFLREAE